MKPTQTNRLILLDRDGTINHERNYLSSPSQIELIPNAAEGIRLFNELGLPVVVISNQSGIGRGYFDLATLERINERLVDLLAQGGARVDAIYFCPHLPEDNCECRKPRTGLARSAASDFKADLGSSFVIGDKPCDIELGEAVGAKTVLVRTGYGAEYERLDGLKPNLIADNLLDAAESIRDRFLGGVI